MLSLHTILCITLLNAPVCPACTACAHSKAEGWQFSCRVVLQQLREQVCAALDSSACHGNAFILMTSYSLVEHCLSALVLWIWKSRKEAYLPCVVDASACSCRVGEQGTPA